MRRKEPGIVEVIASVIATLAFIRYGLPKIFETFQSDLNLVDRLIDISKVLPYPWNIYAGIAALMVTLYAFDRLQKTRWPS